MTEKRFTIDSDGKYFDRVNQRYVTLDKLFDELNNLHEEIERLRKENKELEKFRYAVFKNLHKITEKELKE